jgi:hypothetical protein
MLIAESVLWAVVEVDEGERFTGHLRRPLLQVAQAE